MISAHIQESLNDHPHAPDHVQPSEDAVDLQLLLLPLEEDVDNRRNNPADQEPGLKIKHGSPPIHQRGAHDQRNDLTRLLEAAKHPSADPKDNSPGNQQDDHPADQELGAVVGRIPVPLETPGHVVLTSGHRFVVADHVHVR